MGIKLMKFLLIWIMIGLVVSIGYGQKTKDGKPIRTKEGKRIRYNRYGVPKIDTNGNNIIYSLHELEHQRMINIKKSKKKSFKRDSMRTENEHEADWGFAAFGKFVGLANIIAVPNGQKTEIYLDGKSSCIDCGYYWHSLEYNKNSNNYEQNYISDYFYNPINDIAVADVIGSSDNEIVILDELGKLRLYDQATKNLISEINLNILAYFKSFMKIEDVDRDGQNEIVICTYNTLYVFSATGELEWTSAISQGYGLVIGQMDDDNALEIAVSGGEVFDGVSHLIQWTNPTGFLGRMAVADIDNDNRDELVVNNLASKVSVYDIETQLLKWTMDIDDGVNAMYLGDIDNDSVIELVICLGDSWSGGIDVYNMQTRTREWSIAIPEYRFSNITVADVDGDGYDEILCGSAGLSNNEDRLYIVNVQTRQIEWQNTYLDGPFIGPEFGDLDGDGIDEMVSATFIQGFRSGQILVFNDDGKIRAISDPIEHGDEIYDMKLFDVDGDGKQEIIIGSEGYIGPVIEIYDFMADNRFNLIWTNSINPMGLKFSSVSAGDIDGDGNIEIVAGGSHYSTAATGGYIYVFDYNTGNEVWHSLHMGEWVNISQVELFDLDGDDSIEIIGMIEGGDVYIFDGKTKVLEKIISGKFTTMTLLESNMPTIALGNDLGEIFFYSYKAGDYLQTYYQDAADIKIDGIASKSSTSKLIYGSNGRIHIAVPGQPLWTSARYGSVMGKRFAFRPNQPSMLCTSSYGIFGFDFTSINVKSPNGGESLELGSTHNITWSSVGLTNNVKLLLLKDGALVGLIAKNVDPASGSYSWTTGTYSGGIVPSGTGYTVKIREQGGAEFTTDDSSDASFNISELTLNGPNGGESLTSGSSHNISWNAFGLTNNVKITLWKDGQILGLIAKDVDPLSGSYSWTVGTYSGGTADASNGYQIKIREQGGTAFTMEDISDTGFYISQLTLNSPNGGESWPQGSIRDITWNAAGLKNNVKLLLSKDGAFVGLIAKDVNPLSGSYSWTVGSFNGGNAAVGSGYFVKIREQGGASFLTDDISDDSYSISPGPSITMTSPNGGEDWQIGATGNITWTSTGLTNTVKILLLKDGALVGLIAKNVNAASGTYSWTIGNSSAGTAIAGTGYSIKIREQGGVAFTTVDSSDASFELSD